MIFTANGITGEQKEIKTPRKWDYKYFAHLNTPVLRPDALDHHLNYGNPNLEGPAKIVEEPTICHHLKFHGYQHISL